MKKSFAILLVLLLMLICAAASAQEYYTLPEIREQAATGWHETYTDKYGRTRRVDIDIDVFGEEKAPVLKACWGKAADFGYLGVSVFDANQEAERKRGGERIVPYSALGMEIDLDKKYAEEYENDLTLREVYTFCNELMQAHGNDQEYLWRKPYEFSMEYTAHKKTGDLLVPAFYCIRLWPTEYGLPVLTHVAESYKRRSSGPEICPRATAIIRDRNEYQFSGIDFDVEEILAEDIPLCSVEKVIEGAQKMMEDGYIQQVLSLRFGYVTYTTPDANWGTQQSAYDTDSWYLVPSWVMECYILENPKVDKLPEYPGIWSITINAQTGEMMDHFDNSLYGRGDARYKGFISWNDVQ